MTETRRCACNDEILTCEICQKPIKDEDVWDEHPDNDCLVVHPSCLETEVTQAPSRQRTYSLTVSMDGIEGTDEDVAIDAVFEALAHLSYAIRLERIEAEPDGPMKG